MPGGAETRVARWNFDAAGVYHSGWPATPVGGVLVRNVFHTVVGAYNSDRLPAYRRVDLRASHNINTSLGGLSFFVEVFNVLGTRNVSGVAGYNFNADNKRASSPLIATMRWCSAQCRRSELRIRFSGQWSVVTTSH